MNHKTSNILKYIILFVVTFIMVIPLVWMLLTSLKEQSRVFTQFLPWPIQWSNYTEVLTNSYFIRQFFNSVYIGVLVTVFTILISSLAGYAFARIRFFGSGVVFLLILSALLIPQEVTIIPLFLLMKEFGWLDSHLPLILIPIFGAPSAFGVFLMRQFFITIPKELEEAAIMDGCSKWGIYRRIMMPLAIPTISTLLIFTFVQNWDEFLAPLVFVDSRELMTLPIGLSLFSDEAGTQWHLMMSATSMATLPLLIVFFFAQRRFMEGITLGSLKE